MDLDKEILRLQEHLFTLRQRVRGPYRKRRYPSTKEARELYRAETIELRAKKARRQYLVQAEIRETQRKLKLLLRDRWRRDEPPRLPFSPNWKDYPVEVVECIDKLEESDKRLVIAVRGEPDLAKVAKQLQMKFTDLYSRRNSISYFINRTIGEKLYKHRWLWPSKPRRVQ